MEETLNEKLMRLSNDAVKNMRPASAVKREMGEATAPAPAPENATEGVANANPSIQSGSQETPRIGVVTSPEEAERILQKKGWWAPDGDTLHIGNERVRLWDFDAPERTQEHGQESRNALMLELANAKDVQIERMGSDNYGRTLGRIMVDGKPLAGRMIETGNAVYFQYEEQENTTELQKLEEEARDEGRGLFKATGVARFEPSVYRGLAKPSREMQRWLDYVDYRTKNTTTVLPAEAIEAVWEDVKNAGRMTEEDKRLAPIRGIDYTIAQIAGIVNQYKARGLDVDDINANDLGKILRLMKEGFGYTTEDFQREGLYDPQDAARKYAQQAFDVVETQRRKQAAFNKLPHSERVEQVNKVLFGDDTSKYQLFSSGELYEFSKTMTTSGMLEMAFDNGATAETVATAAMIALSEHQGEEYHRMRLSQMDEKQAKLCANLAGALRAENDSWFGWKGLLSLWNAAESVVNNIGNTLIGETIGGGVTHSRWLDIAAQQLEDTKFETRDGWKGWLDEVAITAGSSLPSMALLAIPKVGWLIYAMNAYADVDKIAYQEDWHNFSEGGREAFKLTYAAVAPIIESKVVSWAMKPLKFLPKSNKYLAKLPGGPTQRSLAMRLASAQTRSVASRITQGALAVSSRSLASTPAEMFEEGATQFVLGLGGMLLDPTTAEGKKLYNIERFGKEIIEAGWSALKTAPFMMAPFTTSGVIGEYSALVSNPIALLGKDLKKPDILGYRQDIVNTIAALDARSNAETIGGLSQEEVANFYKSDSEGRRRILESLKDEPSKKKWLKEIDLYLKYREEFHRTVSPTESVNVPQTEVEGESEEKKPVSQSHVSHLEEIAKNPKDSSERPEAEEDESAQQAPKVAEAADNGAETAQEAKESAEATTPSDAKTEAATKPSTAQKSPVPQAEEAKPKKPSKPKTARFPKKSQKAPGSARSFEARARKRLPKGADGKPTISIQTFSAEIDEAYNGKSGDAVTNPRLVELFKGAIAEEEKTGVGIMDIFSRVYGRKLMQSVSDPDNHQDFKKDPVLWAEATINNLIENARDHKDGDKKALDELNRKYTGKRFFVAPDGPVEQHPRLREFAEFAKSWLRSIYPDANIYFIEEIRDKPAFANVIAMLERKKAIGAINKKNGDIFLSKKANPATILHEIFGHATWAWMEKNDRKNWFKLRELAQNAPQHIIAKVEKNYRKISYIREGDNNNAFLDEVFAHLVAERFAGRADSLFKTHEERAWYKEFWTAITNAIRKFWKAITGSDTEQTPEELLEALATRFFGRESLADLALAPDETVSGMSFEFYTEDESDVMDIRDLYPEDVLENFGLQGEAQALNEQEEQPLDGFSFFDESVIEGEREYYENPGFFNKSEKEKQLSEAEELRLRRSKFEAAEAMYRTALEDYYVIKAQYGETDPELVSEARKEAANRQEEYRAARDAYLKAAHNYRVSNPTYSGLNPSRVELDESVDKLFRLLGFKNTIQNFDVVTILPLDYDFDADESKHSPDPTKPEFVYFGENGGKKEREYRGVRRRGDRDSQVIDEIFGPPRSKWEEFVEEESAKKQGLTREAFLVLTDVAEIFGSGHASRVSYDTEVFDSLSKRLADVKARVIERFKEGSPRSKRILEQIDAAEQCLAYAKMNTREFTFAAGFVLQSIEMLRPGAQRAGFHDTRYFEADLRRYEKGDIDTGVGAAMEAFHEVGFGSIEDGGASLQALVKSYEAYTMAKQVVDNLDSGGNRYLHQHIAVLKDVLKRAEKAANEEFVRIHAENTARGMVERDKKNKNVANKITYEDALEIALKLHAEKTLAGYVKAERELEESKREALGKAIKEGKIKIKRRDNRPVAKLKRQKIKDRSMLRMIRLIEQDDAPADKGGNFLTPAERESLNKMLNQFLKEYEPVKNDVKALDNIIKDTKQDLSMDGSRRAALILHCEREKVRLKKLQSEIIGLYEEMLRNFKACRKNGELYLDSEKVGEIDALKKRVRDLEHLRAGAYGDPVRTARMDAQAAALREKILKLKKARAKEIENGAMRGPTEIVTEIGDKITEIDEPTIVEVGEDGVERKRRKVKYNRGDFYDESGAHEDVERAKRKRAEESWLESAERADAAEKELAERLAEHRLKNPDYKMLSEEIDSKSFIEMATTLFKDYLVKEGVEEERAKKIAKSLPDDYRDKPLPREVAKELAKRINERRLGNPAYRVLPEDVDPRQLAETARILREEILREIEELQRFSDPDENKGYRDPDKPVVYKRNEYTGYETKEHTSPKNIARQLIVRESMPERLREAYRKNAELPRPKSDEQVMNEYLFPKRNVRTGTTESGHEVKLRDALTTYVPRDWVGMYSQMSGTLYAHIWYAVDRKIALLAELESLIQNTIDAELGLSAYQLRATLSNEEVLHRTQFPQRENMKTSFTRDKKRYGRSYDTETEIKETDDDFSFEIGNEQENVVDDFTKKVEASATSVAAAVALRMKMLRKDSLTQKEIEDILYTYNEKIGGKLAQDIVNVARVIAGIVREMPGFEKMSSAQIVEACENIFKTADQDTMAKLVDAVMHVQTDEWKAESEKYKAHLERMEKTGRLLPFAPMTARELGDAGVITGGRRSNLYKNDKSSDEKPRISILAFMGLNKKVYNYLFGKHLAPTRKMFATDREYRQALEDHEKSQNSVALVSKYRDTLVWLYGKYATNPFLRKFFYPGTAAKVKRLVAQMRDYADTKEQIIEYARRIEAILGQDNKRLNISHLKWLIQTALEKYAKPYDPNTPLEKRKISPFAYAQLHAAYKAMSMTEKELEKEIDETDRKFEQFSKDELKKSSDGGMKATKNNASKAIIEYNKAIGYRLMQPYVKDKALSDKQMFGLREVYERIEKIIAEGGQAVETHIDDETTRVESFVEAITEIIRKDSEGYSLAGDRRTAVKKFKDVLYTLVSDGFTLKQRLEELGRRIKDPKDKARFTELCDEFINNPIAKAESERSEFYRNAREARNVIVSRVYHGGDVDVDKVLDTMYELNLPVAEFAKFSERGVSLTRAELMNQLAMLTQDEVQAPIRDIETKLRTGELLWDKSEQTEQTKDVPVISPEAKAMVKRMRRIPEMKEALERISGGKDLKMIDALMAYYKSVAPQLDDVSMQVTGAPISVDSERYYPVWRSSEWASRGLDRSRQVITAVPDFLSPRTETTTDIAEEANIFSVFDTQAEKTAHFLAFGPFHYRFSGLLENKSWSRLTEDMLGSNGSKLLKDHFQDVCAPNLVFIDNSGASAFWKMARGWTSILLLGGNILVGLKQASSISAFSHEVGWHKLLTSIKNPFSDEIRQARKELFESPEGKERWGESFGPDWLEVQNALMEGPGKSKRLTKFFAWYMTPQRHGDKIASFFVAPGLYLANYQMLRSRYNPETGKVYTEVEAKTVARQMTFDAIEKTQQTSRASNLGHTQRRGDAMKQMWIQFLSAPILLFSSEARAVRDFASARTKENAKKLVGNLVSNHIIIPAALWGLEAIIGALFKGEEPDEETFLELAKMILSGPASGLILLGNIALSDSDRDVAAPSASFLGRAFRSVGKLGTDAITGEFAELPGDLNKLLRSSIPLYRNVGDLWNTYASDESD